MFVKITNPIGKTRKLVATESTLNEMRKLSEKAFGTKTAECVLCYKDVAGDLIDIVDQEDFEICIADFNENCADKKGACLHLFLVHKEKDLEELVNTSFISEVSLTEVEKMIESKITERLQKEKQIVDPPTQQITHSKKIIPKEAADEQTSKQVVHVGVRCDNCHTFPIIGTRFKSLHVMDTDLCSACESLIKPELPFLRLNTPLINPGFLQRDFNLYASYFQDCEASKQLSKVAQIPQKESEKSKQIKVMPCHIRKAKLTETQIRVEESQAPKAKEEQAKLDKARLDSKIKLTAQKLLDGVKDVFPNLKVEDIEYLLAQKPDGYPNNQQELLKDICLKHYFK